MADDLENNVTISSDSGSEGEEGLGGGLQYLSEEKQSRDVVGSSGEATTRKLDQDDEALGEDKDLEDPDVEGNDEIVEEEIEVSTTVIDWETDEENDNTYSEPNEQDPEDESKEVDDDTGFDEDTMNEDIFFIALQEEKVVNRKRAREEQNDEDEGDNTSEVTEKTKSDRVPKKKLKRSKDTFNFTTYQLAKFALFWTVIGSASTFAALAKIGSSLQ
ncbi:BA75_04272T0 [Komagataella pastoris]|uniref:BA75_04272T0 n=1 Tax=Komagataella pastoris TaxID=4922 RepID=A0A1B2JEY3_PICPA|nr:BA75_04272T0 [Komagataella pastoris]